MASCIGQVSGRSAGAGKSLLYLRSGGQEDERQRHAREHTVAECSIQCGLQCEQSIDAVGHYGDDLRRQWQHAQ